MAPEDEREIAAERPGPAGGGAGHGPAHPACRGIRALAEARVADAAAQAASRFGPAGTNGVVFAGRFLSYADAVKSILYENATSMLVQLDPRNGLLRIANPPDWVPSLEDIARINKEIKAIRSQQALRNLEGHHELVQQYRTWFKQRGIEPDD